MELTIEQKLQQGVAAHKEGKLQEAEGLYRTILQSQPAHPDANHNLGVLAVSVNKADAALPLFKLALEGNPKIEQFWLSYINALIKEEQFENAKKVLEQGKKQGVAGEKLNALAAQLASINQIENVDSASPSQQQLSSLSECYQNGQYGDAEELAISITEQFPEHQFSWKVLGAVLKQTGRVSESLVANQKSVELAPQDTEAHNNLGVTLQALGRLQEAEASYRLAIALKPDFAAAQYNLGNTLKGLDRLEEAEASYRQAIALKSGYAEAHSNLGNMLKELGRLEEAEASYRQAIAITPDYADAHCNLGTMLKERGRSEEAEASYRQAIALKFDYADAHFNLGTMLKERSRLEEAEASYRQAIAFKPDYAEAKHQLAALTGETTKSAPRDYVERLFDNYASKFDTSLVDNLEYKIPKIIAEMIMENHNDGSLGSVLDLGCGTGLTGSEIRQFCAYLEGIDLSNSMLEQAKRKNVYDNLIHRDITEYLATENLDFDYFISTDVFVYLGDLSTVFQLIKSRNKSGGKLVFSTENTDKDGFFLEQSGRYSHSKQYIEGLCEKFDYKLCHFENLSLRKEKNLYISGGLYLLIF